MVVPKLNAVLETALYVEDLERSVSFYKTIFEFETLSSDERLCALNVSNQQVLLLFLKGASTVVKVTSGGIIPPHDGDGELHLAEGSRSFKSCYTTSYEWQKVESQDALKLLTPKSNSCRMVIMV